MMTTNFSHLSKHGWKLVNPSGRDEFSISSRLHQHGDDHGGDRGSDGDGDRDGDDHGGNRDGGRDDHDVDGDGDDHKDNNINSTYLQDRFPEATPRSCSF